MASVRDRVSIEPAQAALSFIRQLCEGLEANEMEREEAFRMLNLAKEALGEQRQLIMRAGG